MHFYSGPPMHILSGVDTYRESTKHRPAFFAKILYKGRARIEQGNGKLKRFKRIALRCEKTAQNFAAFISLACTFILVKSVHTT